MGMKMEMEMNGAEMGETEMVRIEMGKTDVAARAAGGAVAGAAVRAAAPARGEAMLSKERVVSYLWFVLFLPYGLYRIWRSGSSFCRAEKYVWTVMAAAYLIRLIFGGG